VKRILGFGPAPNLLAIGKQADYISASDLGQKVGAGPKGLFSKEHFRRAYFRNCGTRRVTIKSCYIDSAIEQIVE
jgi:hypothetical protein